jgi:hypothetical protein
MKDANSMRGPRAVDLITPSGPVKPLKYTPRRVGVVGCWVVFDLVFGVVFGG